MNNKSIRAIEVFKKGGIVIFPTDTAFGIGCRMDNAESVKRVFEIKERSFSDALLVLVDSVEMAERYVDIPSDAREKLVQKYWPGGLSILFKTKPGKVLGIVTAKTPILAIRWPDHKMIEQIIHEVDVPIIATSANVSGGITPYTLGDVDQKLLEQVDFVLPGECTHKKESTIIDTTVTPWKTIRQGAVQLEISNI